MSAYVWSSKNLKDLKDHGHQPRHHAQLTGFGESLQGYLAHEKRSPRRTLQQLYVWGPVVILGGWVFFHERGTPVTLPHAIWAPPYMHSDQDNLHTVRGRARWLCWGTLTEGGTPK